MRLCSRLPIWLLTLTVLSGCALNFDAPEQVSAPARKTLGEVYFEPLPLNHDPMPDKGLKNLRDAYAQLLAMPIDDDTRKTVQYRLADLEVLLAEQNQESGAPIDQGYFDLAIAQYQSILQQHPEQTENAEVLYQLAKSYDLQGQSEKSFAVIEQLLQRYPDTIYRAELHFRRGEILFAQKEYLSAIESYRAVLQLGQQNDYFMTSAYMLGWSYFKVDQQHNALLAFTQLLDQKLPNSVIDQQMMRQLTSEQQLESLLVGEKRLVNDTIRIMALLFSYQGAERSIEAFYQEVGNRHYEYLLYEQLGQQFLNEDRFRDSALVYRAFTEVHPDHSQAPFFAVKQIDAYILGDFPTLVLPAKQDFVKRYGINGEFWSAWGQLLQEQVKPFLHNYIQELAQFEHAKAQLLAKAATSKQAEKDKGPTSAAENHQNALLAFGQAAALYREFIQTFPYDEKTPSIVFNLAESLFDGERYQESIKAFETYAYQYLDEPKAAEAGYGAILAFRALQTTLTNPQDKQMWRDEQLASQKQFVNRFSQDSRAVDVLYDSMQQLFELQRFNQAIDSAYQLLDWQPKVDTQRTIAGQLVVAHSQFALENYADAEQSYQRLLAQIPIADTRHAELLERLAASIYKQGEINLAKQYLPLAVEDFLRVIEKAPTSTIRINAQYDAATYLLELGQWLEAAELLEDFRVRFASHPLTANIRDKLIYAYQQSERWLVAAQELKALWQSQPDTEEGRQALYVAAQYFKRAEQRDLALDTYRTYAHKYPEPFDEVTEARFEMSEFYRQSSEDAKRRFWLKKLISGDSEAGAQRTERSRYLAAMSSWVFAQDAVAAFDKVKLSLPLKTSLKRKKAAMETAMKRLDATLEYKIAEFSTSANYAVGQVYAQLAKDLMNSERPKGLNALELEQYDILLEEQAYPFEEQAIGVHETNAKRSWQGVYDQWVQNSFSALSELLPGRYNKAERVQETVDEIF